MLPPLKASPAVDGLDGHRGEQGWSICFTVLLHNIPAFLQGSARKLLGNIWSILMQILLKVLPPCLQLQEELCAVLSVNLIVNVTLKHSGHDSKPSVLLRWH